jgi:hypothetical protein
MKESNGEGVVSCEILGFGEPTASARPEGNNEAWVSASMQRPRGVEDPRHAKKLHAREPRDPAAARCRKAAGRREKAMSHKSLMHRGPHRRGKELRHPVLPKLTPQASHVAVLRVRLGCGCRVVEQRLEFANKVERESLDFG